MTLPVIVAFLILAVFAVKAYYSTLILTERVKLLESALSIQDNRIERILNDSR